MHPQDVKMDGQPYALCASTIARLALGASFEYSSSQNGSHL